MWITRESGLGLLALVEIARHGRCTAEEIAERYGLSAPFLRQIMGHARRAGLVLSSPGRSGGYTLARPAANITLKEALASLGERLAPVACLAGIPCSQQDTCPTRPLWERLEERIEEWLREVTLEDLAKGRL